MKKYFCQYRHRRGSGMITLFLLFFLLSSGSVLGQDILFYEDFGDPTLATERRIWPYMPTGNNPFNPLADPITGSLEIEGEGTWSYDANTGGLTFTSVSGFLGEPTPIYYVFEEDNGDGKRSNRAKVTITLDESVEIKNYWIGGTIGAPNDWDVKENWTARLVPKPGEDVEFATEANNGV